MPTTPPTWRKFAGGWLLLLALIGLAILRSAWGTQLDTFTIDESYHIVAGISYARTGDLRLNPEHPPLLKHWVGAWMPDTFKMRPFRPLNEKVEERDFTEAIIYADNNAAAVQTIARRAVWTYHAILLLVLGLLIWRAAGLAWAAGALAFLAIEPTVGAHLPVVMTDLPVALSLAIAAVAAGLAVSTWQWRWMIVLGIALGVAVGSKHSALPGLLGLGAVCIVAVFASRTGAGRGAWKTRLLQIAFAAVLGYAVIWAQYAFRFHAGPDSSDAYNRTMSDKIADLRIDHWRKILQFADDWHLMPRPYLWGLADTLRAGVEGRGEDQTLIYGKTYEGRAPWFTWPAIISAKIPLALFALALLGVSSLRWRSLGSSQRWMLLALAGISVFHLAALMGSRGTYAGVRHAMPIVMTLAIVAGAAAWRAVAMKSRPFAVAYAALWLVALVMTAREPRLWEYHNELAGGSDEAWRNFSNEGVDLGQRFGEFVSFHRRVIQPSGRPYYAMSWMMLEEQAKGSGAMYERFAKGIEDTNTEARFDGYFLIENGRLRSDPSRKWDPAVLSALREVAHFGSYRVLEGQVVQPRFRAWSLSQQIREYIYRTPNPDWAKVALRLREVVKEMPWSVGNAIELGNANLKLDRREEAVAAYTLALQNLKSDDLTHREVSNALARLQSGDPLNQIRPVRNPMME
jgi:hypothetical protein